MSGRSSSTRSTRVAAGSSLKPGDVPKVVVGSRAEAKAVRAAAVLAEKQRAAKAKAAEKNRARAAFAPSAQTVAAGVVHWSITDAAMAVSLLFVLIVAKEAVLGSQAMSLMPAAGQIASRAVVLGLFYALLAAGLAFLANRHGSRLLQAFGLAGAGTRNSAGHALSAALVVGLLVGTRLFSLAWGAFARVLGWAPPGSGELTTVFGVGGFGLFLSAVAVVIVGPLVEELVFRGVVLRAALDRVDFWPAIALSAGLFALSHATAWTLVPTFVLGLAAGWLALRTQSLWPPIALHALYNGVVVGLAYWIAG